MTLTDHDLRCMFGHKSDCYAKTTDDKCHAAMTAERFVEVVRHLRSKTTTVAVEDSTLRKLFDNKSDCYAEPIDDCVLAMSADRFVEVARTVV